MARRPIVRILNGFADTLLQRAQPALLQWLSSRLGDGVSVGRLQTEGSSIVVYDAVLPLGAAVLHVDQATFRIALGQHGVPGSLVALRGELVVPSAAAGTAPTFRAPLSFVSDGDESDAWIRGKLQVSDASWAVSAGQDAQAPLSGTFELEVTRDRFRLEDGEATAGDATIALSLAGRFDDAGQTVDEARLRVANARIGHFLDALVALTGRELRLPFPISAEVKCTGRIELVGDRLEVSLGVSSQASQLIATGHGNRSAIEQGKLAGRLHPWDILSADRSVRERDPDGEEPFGVELLVRGPFGELEGELSLQSGAASAEGSFDLGAGELAVRSLGARLAVRCLRLAGVGALGVTHAEEGRAPVKGFALPDDATVDAMLQFREHRWSGEVGLRTPRSELRLAPFHYRRAAGDFEAGAFEGSRLFGTLDAHDAVAAGLFPSPLRPSEGSAELDLALQWAGRETSVEGTVTAASLFWTLGGATPVELTHAKTGLRVDGSAVTLTGLEGRLLEGTIAVDTRIVYPVDGVFHLPKGSYRLSGVRARRWLGERFGISLPPGVVLDTDLQNRSGALLGPLRLTTARSSITASVSLSPEESLSEESASERTVSDGSASERRASEGRAPEGPASASVFDGTEFSGTLALSDLYELLPRGRWLVTGKGALEIEGTVKGLASPKVKLIARGEALQLLVAGPGTDFRLPADRFYLATHVDRERFLFSDLSIGAFGGTLRSQGRLGFRPTLLQAKVQLEDLAVGDVRLAGGAIGAHLTGQLHGTLSVQRKGTEAVQAHGSLRVDEPSYPALRRAEPALAKYGLSAIAQDGTTPLHAELLADAHGLHFRQVRAATLSGAVEADARISGGAVDGRGTARVAARYLRTSSLLRVPAAVAGDIAVPFRVAGSVRAPRVQANLVGTLDTLLAESAVGAGLRGLQNAVGDFFGGASSATQTAATQASSRRASSLRASGPSGGAPADLDTDVLIDRIAQGVGDEDAYIDELFDRGLSPEELADRIEEARERLG